jgi:hypothetical protein
MLLAREHEARAEIRRGEGEIIINHHGPNANGSLTWTSTIARPADDRPRGQRFGAVNPA